MSLPSPKNIKLTLAYEGTDFFGWQKNEGASVEAVLESVLQQILQEKIELQAASRTDRGVHATGQVVNFFTYKNISCAKLQKSINALAPPSIRILSVAEMELSFHPTLDATAKQYCYQLDMGLVQLPQRHRVAWHVPTLDLEAMRACIPLLVGEKDFTSFCNSRKNIRYNDKKRTLFSLQIEENSPSCITITIEGNHFMYKMVRNLVGALVGVGCGKLTFDDITQILHEKKRAVDYVTAPAHGLTLTQVSYKSDPTKNESAAMF